MTLGLIICEKPSVGKSVSFAVNAKSNRADGYFDGDKYITTFVFGHMYELFDAKDYDPKFTKWNKENYPFIPTEFKYKIRDDKGVKKQVKTINDLVNRKDISHVIIATDNDLEGALIGDVLVKELKVKKPIKRLLINSHTPDEVRKGMNDLRDYKDMANQIKASYCRQHSDYAIGINYTVLSSVCYSNGSQLLACGRIIMPTLFLIYNRDKDILNFKKEPYHELRAIFSCNKQQYEGLYMNSNKETRFKNKDTLNTIKDKVENKHGIITEKETKSVKEVAPLLFNLTDLQGHISSKYDIPGDKTKEIAQQLYENGYISYPRTASRHLDDSQGSEIERVLDVLIKDYPDDYNIVFKKDKRIFDSSKIDSHPALTPTYQIPTDLTKEQSLVYEEIKKRFISQFMPANEYEQTIIVTDVDGYKFITKEKIIVREGWIKLYKDDTKVSIVNLKIKLNDIAKVEHLQVLDKETEPPKKYTEKTLLSAMENCGKSVSPEDVEHILKGYSIGTADTRASTIKRLIELGYIERKGKSLSMTPLGKELVEVFPVRELLDTDFTGRIQKSLKDIEKGVTNADVFMERMKAFVIKNSEKFVEKKLSSTNQEMDKKLVSLGKCPECGKDVVEGKKAYGCSGYKDGCNFAIWYNQLEKLGMKKVNKTVAKKLLNKEKASTKLKSPKSGKDFECNLVLNKEGEKWGVKLEYK